jgi:acyl-[acyl-carrier-protein]-phospholipid O-acyltransferase / long-chain-fatty-acid--[acyl-carrier-protein] ligase
MTQAATHKKGPVRYDRIGFWAFIATQFQGAFSDNVYRWVIVLYAPVLLSDAFPVTSLATALFNVPWLLFPAIAGAIGDKFSKKQVTVATKFWEVMVMATGVVAVLLGSPVLLFITLFLMAMQSAFFSPAKYGIMPEMLPESRLSWGNGQLNMWTFVAIILGTAVAGIMLDVFAGRVYMAMTVIVGFSLIGMFTSLFVTPVPPAEPARKIPVNPWKGMGPYFRMFVSDRLLFLTMVGIAYFWFAGTLVIQNVTELGKDIMSSNQEISYLLAAMALGIGIGSLLAGYLSRGKIETGLVPFGFFGMTLSGILLAVPGLPVAGIFVFLFLLGIFAGFFDVPLAAMLQQRSGASVKGGMIATSNFVTFSAMMVAAGLFWFLFNKVAMPPKQIFLVIAVLTFGTGIYMVRSERIFILRMALWLLDGTFYKLRVRDREHLPEKGGALMVSTHISFIDTFSLLMSTDRNVHFVMGAGVMRVKWMRRIASMMNVVLVPEQASQREFDEVVAAIRALIAAGHVVCVNREMKLQAEGETVPWHRDYGLLVRDLDAPVVPVFMEQLWESTYIQKEGRFHYRWPGRPRFPIHIYYGEALPGDTPAVDVREAVQLLGVDFYMHRSYRHKVLHRAFIRTARRNPRQFCMADATAGSISYFKALAGGIIFARKLKPLLGDRKMVGVLVPPTAGGALTNIALQMLGKVPVNLNYTTPAETMKSCAARCGITHVLTARQFLERLPLDVPGEAVYLEDIRDSVSGKDRITGMLLALFAPIPLLEKLLGTPRIGEEDLATIIFSSGSEGEPKGVMLSQKNIMSQTHTVAQIVAHDRHTCVVGFLPFFHSFGFTGTLWMPIVNGVRCVFHPNPLEPRQIGSLTKKYQGTFLIGTSTFLQGFIRRCTPEQLTSLKMVIAGAEKLPARIRCAFKEKFGAEPMEGFGATECAPVVSVNLPDQAAPGFYVTNVRHGTIGRPMPGQCVRISDPDTGELLPVGEAGLMEVRGPNVMQGYLEDPERTEAALNAGWYSTGDIASLDEEGFITIRDRLARFSKIAGEMVPHNRIEEVLHALLELTEQRLAVSSVPDNARGERLIVLHTLADEDLDTLLEKLASSELPNLWRPRPNAFYRIEEIPVLGSGKMDLKEIRKQALALDLGE